ncbi:MAG: glycoside hydrolase family 5 protein [Chloroflexi bacterium]|nr:glycoside hydrolase family 5 protein [Chloroflexota bacterium]
MTTWTDDPLSKAVPIKAQHLNELRAAVEAVPGVSIIPWGRGSRVDTATPIHAQHMLDLRQAIGPGSAPGTVWNVRGVNAGAMLWTQSVPGATTPAVIRATHVDDLRRWFNTSELAQPGYDFPHVRPLLFGINPSWISQQPVGQQYYNDDQMLTAIKQAGATCMRWGIGWDVVEPNPPVNGVHTYYFAGENGGENYDYEVNKALSYGITYVMNVQGCPLWANGGNQGVLMPPTNAHLSDFQAFVTALAQHFVGKVHHYEFVNEPNGSGNWYWTTSDNYQRGQMYATYLQTFYQAIKSIDATAWVSTGGVDNIQTNSGLQFIQGIYQQSGSPTYFDAVACHPYPPPYPLDEGSTNANNCPGGGPPPSLVNDGVIGLRQLMNCYGDFFKPIWITEYGYHRSSFTPPPDPATQQASNLQQALSWLSQLTQNYVTITTYQISADISGSSAQDMGLLSSTLAPYTAYSTFSSFGKPTT